MPEKVILSHVEEKDSDIRLDRWFKRYYPGLRHGALERLLRGKNIRVNGKKATADQHLKTGDEIYLLDNQNGKYVYTIYDIYKVKPNNTSPLKQNTNGKRIITLITCVNYSDNRLIVQAVEK